jgi:hypothetical protein
MNARHCVAATFVALALWPSPALAQPSDVDRATARALTLEGYEALDRKDYATAADRFTRADALYHAPTVMLGLAHAQVGLGKLVEALVTYSRIANEAVPPNAPAAFAKAVDDARRELAALMPRIPNVIVNVKGAQNAKVTIDGVEVPAAALGVKRPVDPGAHVIRATAPNAAPKETTITILEGKLETVTIELQQSAAPPPATPPPVNATPVAPPPMTAPPPVEPPLPQGTSGLKIGGFVSLGVGAAGLVLAGVTGGMALSKHSALVEKCPDGRCYSSQQSALKSDVDSYHTLGAVSTAGFVIAGAGVATGVVLLIAAPKSAPQKDAAVMPLVGPGFVGARGRF